MKTRKLVLIIADVLLLVVGIIQIIVAGRTTVKNFQFSEQPDTILIEKYDGTLNLVKDGENWLINNEKYEATLSNVDSMIDYAKAIVALDKVAKLTNDAAERKYEFDEEWLEQIDYEIERIGKRCSDVLESDMEDAFNKWMETEEDYIQIP